MMERQYTGHALTKMSTPQMMQESVRRKGYSHRRQYVKKVLPPAIITYLRSLNDNRREAVSRSSRLVIILICSGALFFYLYRFFELYLEYPTVVDVTVRFPDVPELPGITICNHNVVRLKYICEWNETLCTDDQLEMFDVRDYLTQTNASEIFRVSHQRVDLFAYCEMNTKMESINITDVCRNASFLYFENYKCNTINGLFDEAYTAYPIYGNETSFRMILNLEPDEYLIKNGFAAEIYVHSPYQLPDARSSHFSAYAGKIYTVGISKTTARLLEKPYRTGCTNYSRLHLEGKLHGYISQSTCQEDCLRKEALKNCSCIPNCLSIWNDSQKCVDGRPKHKTCCTDLNTKRPYCHEQCPVACDFRIYDLSPNDEVLPKLSLVEKGITITDEVRDLKDRYTNIVIMLKMVRDTVYEHNPKITAVEILGYVGGYVGIFLGVSIPLLYNYFLQLMEYTLTVLWKRRNKNSRSTQTRAFRV